MKKIYGFDYLKIIAASLIVLHHYQQVFECSFSGINFWGGKISFGYLVELFFIISGFLTVYAERNRNRLVRCGGGQRLLHKLLRICPMAWISMLVCLILKIAINIFSNIEVNQLLSAKVLVANFMFLFAGYPHFSMIGINNPLWYVCILIQCFIVYYITDGFCKKYNLDRVICYIIILIMCVIVYRYVFYNEESFRGLSSFFIGVLLCCLTELFEVKHILNKCGSKVLGIAFIILSVLGILVILEGMSQRWGLQFWVFPSLIMGVYFLNIVGNNLVSEIAEISFEVYVWHYPLMVGWQLINIFTGEKIKHSYITMAVFLVLVWMVAFILWKFIDLPLRNKIRGFEKGLLGK